VKIKTEIRNKGNWNYKDDSVDAIYTKPIGVLLIDGDEFVLKHDDIYKIIEFYHEVDINTVRKINNTRFNSGDIKNAELLFIYKLKQKLNEIERKLMEGNR